MTMSIGGDHWLKVSMTTLNNVISVTILRWWEQMTLRCFASLTNSGTVFDKIA
jgi:hypothetical protein